MRDYGVQIENYAILMFKLLYNSLNRVKLSYLRGFMRTPGGRRVTMRRSEYFLLVRVLYPPLVGQPHGVDETRPFFLPLPATTRRARARRAERVRRAAARATSCATRCVCCAVLRAACPLDRKES